MQNVVAPKRIATEAFTDASVAVARLEEIYDRNTRFLRDHFEQYANGATFGTRLRAHYPFVRITTSTHAEREASSRYRSGRPHHTLPHGEGRSVSEIDVHLTEPARLV